MNSGYTEWTQCALFFNVQTNKNARSLQRYMRKISGSLSVAVLLNHNNEEAVREVAQLLESHRPVSAEPWGKSDLLLSASWLILDICLVGSIVSSRNETSHNFETK